MRIAIYLIFFGLVGCASPQLPQGPEADLSKTSMIRLGTEQTEVLNIMGMYPQKTEISDGVTEWHYCATGYGMDEFVAVYFAEEKVVAMKNYQVTEHDSQGIYGHCSKFVKMGTYREPADVKEIRVRYTNTNTKPYYVD